ncbi:MAG: hypothetical protein QG608_3239 [Actinomycetota bacterium]|nr:hypothetical protein [Actinomycetota bacterium]
MVQAAAVLRGQGVTSVALTGSSLGSVSALVAASPEGPRRAVFPHDDRAPVLPEAPCATILISPILDWEENTGTVSALAAPNLPNTVWIVHEKNNSSIVADAARLRTRLSGAGSPKRSGAALKELSVATSDHSLALVENHDEVLPFLTEALSSCHPS